MHRKDGRWYETVIKKKLFLSYDWTISAEGDRGIKLPFMKRYWNEAFSNKYVNNDASSYEFRNCDR